MWKMATSASVFRNLDCLLIVVCLFVAIQLCWNFKPCFYFFSKICASKLGVRLIYGCGLYMDVYGKLRKIWNVEDFMHLENWNLKWRISRWAPNSPPTNLGLFFFGGGGGREGVNCLVVSPTHFNPYNSLLIHIYFSKFHPYSCLRPP